MIRALVFDFDGLIIDTETPLIGASARVHAAHGVTFDRTAFIRSVGHADYTFDPWHGFSPHADRAALEIERRTLKDDLMLAQPILPGVRELLVAQPRCAGVRELRVAAEGRRLRIGLASNSGHSWCEPHLRRLELPQSFE